MLTILSEKTRPAYVDLGSGYTQHGGNMFGLRPADRALQQVASSIGLIRLGTSDLSRSFIPLPD